MAQIDSINDINRDMIDQQALQKIEDTAGKNWDEMSDEEKIQFLSNVAIEDYMSGSQSLEEEF